jgi:hypothetical protein
MIAAFEPHKMTAEAYLRWEAQQETRHEYLNGEILSDRVAVDYFRRGEGRMWLYTRYEAGETLMLQGLGIDIDVDAIYEAVRLDFERPSGSEA